MSDWLDQFSAALDVRDIREQAHRSYIDAYTKLADRKASASTLPVDGVTATRPPSATLPDRSLTPTKPQHKDNPVTPPASDLLSALRTDLATTQKARTVLQSRVDELSSGLSKLQKQEQRSTIEIAQLKKQKVEVERKLKDREEEIRGKASLVENAQDEMVALEMQLNLSEQRKEVLERENKELVARWMKRIGAEAEQVNRDSRWE